MSDRALQLIPEEQDYIFRRLPKTVQDEYYRIVNILPDLLAAGSLLAACMKAAPAVQITCKALYERVRKYVATRDWQALINKSKGGKVVWKPSSPGTQPARFQEWCKGIFERFQRNNRRGYAEIIYIWQHHRTSTAMGGKSVPVLEIPGYATWPEADRLGKHPEGWSYKNLMRFAPDNYDAAAARQGRFTASMFRPPVCKSRVGLKFLERSEFDDHEWNLKIHYPGQAKAMRPRGFVGAEALSGKLIPSFKPTLWDPDAEMKKALTERDFMWFIVNWLCTVGYRTDARGSWLIVELGTAAIKDAFRDRILRATRDEVRVSEPGMFNTPAHGGQIGGKGSGNFKHKPLVESSFNLIDNYFAGLPGQTGLDRLTSPEDAGKREQYFGQLLRAAKTLPDERAAKLMLPFLTWGEFLATAMDLTTAICESGDHEMEGWDELDFHAPEFRLPMGDGFTPWQARAMLDRLPEEQRPGILALIGAREDLRQTRRMSRNEVFHREHARALASKEVVKLSPWTFAELLGLENGHEVTVGKNHLIEIHKAELGLKPLRFLASINDHHLQTGEKFLGFINPWQPHVGMLLTKHNGAGVGIAEYWDSPSVTDEAAVLRQVGKQAHWEATRLAKMEERHAPEAAAVEHMRAHNAAVIADKDPRTEQQKQLEDRIEKKANRSFSSQQDALNQL